MGVITDKDLHECAVRELAMRRGVYPKFVRSGRMTQEQADAQLVDDIQWAVGVVNSKVKAPLNQNQFNAFTLFTYNVGGEAFCRSSLLKKLNAGDYAGACNGLLAWDRADGKVVPGLLARRKFERDWCLRPVVKEVAEAAEVTQ